MHNIIYINSGYNQKNFYRQTFQNYWSELAYSELTYAFRTKPLSNPTMQAWLMNMCWWRNVGKYCTILEALPVLRDWELAMDLVSLRLPYPTAGFSSTRRDTLVNESGMKLHQFTCSDRNGILHEVHLKRFNAGMFNFCNIFYLTLSCLWWQKRPDFRWCLSDTAGVSTQINPGAQSISPGAQQFLLTMFR